MLNPSLTALVVLAVVGVVTGLWPDHGDKPPPEAPKKGSWQASDMVWPIRRVYRDLTTINASFLRSSRRCLYLAFMLAVVVHLATQYAPATESPNWFLLECGVIGLLVGRASGFWSADRRLRSHQDKSDQAD